MTKIYIGFSYPKSFKPVAYTIKTWMRTNYSHVYLRFESSNPKVPSNVYHAANGMVHFMEFENFKENNLIIKEYCLELSEEDRLDTLVECMLKSGIKYGYSELFKILLTDIGHTVGVHIETYNGKGYICSELVGTLLIHRLKLKFDKPTHLLKPVDIELKLQEYQKA